MRGFTLVETLFVIGLITLLLVLILPFGLEFYENQQLSATTQNIIQILRRAQLKSISQELDSSYGVYLTNDNFILFKGVSYLLRDPQYDEVFDIPTSIESNGINEVVFSRLEGQPNITGNIVLTNNRDTMRININEVGRINLE